MGNHKGQILNGALKYIKEKYGEEKLGLILAALTDDERTRIEKGINIIANVPVKIFEKVITNCDKMLGQGDYALCREIGRFGAEDVFGGIYKVFLEIGQPKSVIKNATLAWRTINDRGRLELVKLEDQRTIVRIIDWEDYHQANCHYLEGLFERTLELAGGKEVKVKELKCRGDGGNYCEYSCEWK